MMIVELRERRGKKQSRDVYSPHSVKVDDVIVARLEQAGLFLYYSNGFVNVRDNKGYGERLATYILGVASWTPTNYINGDALDCRQENLEVAKVVTKKELREQRNYSLTDVL